MKTKVLQFGSGVFLRGFFGWMVQQLKENLSLDASITMVKLTPRGDLSHFEQVDGRYGLLTRGLSNGQVIDEQQTVSVYDAFINPYEQWSDFLASARDSELQVVVSNSTEAGIVYKHCPLKDQCPETYPAKLCAWLYARFQHFDRASDKAPLLLPMELVENNGGKLKEIVLQHAEDWDCGSPFKNWLNDHCDFRNTLVDRIVTKGDGLEVIVEPYHLFAIEGSAAEDLLPLKKAGINVFWTDDLASFRETKVRMLNGAHTAMIYGSILSGYSFVKQALADERIDAFLQSALIDEVLPTLQARGAKHEDLQAYAAAVVERFKNPFLEHRMLDIALNSSSKLLVRIMPSYADYYRLNESLPAKLTQSLAAFFWFYRGRVIDGKFHGESEGLVYEFGDDSQAMQALADCDRSSAKAFAHSILHCPLWQGAFDDFDGLEETLTQIFEGFEKQGLQKTLF